MRLPDRPRQRAPGRPGHANARAASPASLGKRPELRLGRAVHWQAALRRRSGRSPQDGLGPGRGAGDDAEAGGQGDAAGPQGRLPARTAERAAGGARPAIGPALLLQPRPERPLHVDPVHLLPGPSRTLAAWGAGGAHGGARVPAAGRDQASGPGGHEPGRGPGAEPGSITRGIKRAALGHLQRFATNWSVERAALA